MNPVENQIMKPAEGGPLLMPAQQAFASIGCRTTKGYRLIGEGLLVAVKSGPRTMVTTDSVRAYVAGLPRLPAKYTA